ncbi:MAG: MBL fold metallo-hydrolase [Acidimicrobiales bacterium]
MSLELTILGCDGSYPGPGGACSGYLVEGGDRLVWLDIGPGTLATFQQLSSFDRLDAVVVSHEHPDHSSDIDGLAVALRAGQEGGRRLPVYAAPGVRERSYFGQWEVLDWHVVGDGDRISLDGLELSFSRTDHGPVTLALRIDGGGASLGYSADSGPGWSLEALGPGLDLALCEATWTAREEGRRGHHMSARQAGESARAAGAAQMVVTHRWPTVAAEVVAAEAAEAFGASVQQARPRARFVVGSTGEGAGRATTGDGAGRAS